MRYRWLAAVALVLGAGQAEAADYLTYKFAVNGTATRGFQSSGGMPIFLSGPLIGDVVFVMPTSIVGQTSIQLNQSSTPLFAEDDLGWIATGSGLVIGETTQPYARGANRTISLTACGPISVVPGASVAIDPGCSAFSFFSGLPQANDGASFNGTVTGLTVTEGFGTPAAFGFVSAPLLPPIPEPASWIMAILGFGLVGAALRRQQQQQVVAAA